MIQPHSNTIHGLPPGATFEMPNESQGIVRWRGMTVTFRMPDEVDGAAVFEFDQFVCEHSVGEDASDQYMVTPVYRMAGGALFHGKRQPMRAWWTVMVDGDVARGPH